MSIKALSDYTFYSRYSQYLPEKNRRETWEESVHRIFNMHRTKYAAQLESNPELVEALNFAERQVLKKRVLGSQRTLQYGGDPILKRNERLYNCLEKNTEFITSQGVKKFSDFEHGEVVRVPNSKGQLVDAVVKTYGKQSLNKITFSRGVSEFSILATENHRWILSDLTETTSLSVGDSVLSAPKLYEDFVYEDASVFEKLYWCYGYVYGDGTLIKDGSGEYKYSAVRLCGHDKNFAERFEEAGFKTSSSLSLNGDFMAYTGTYLKTLPNPEIDDPKLIRAFIYGYLAADGAKNRNVRQNCNKFNKYISIQSSSEEGIKFIRKYFPSFGFFIVSEKDLTGQKTNLGTRDKTISFRICDSINHVGNSLRYFKVKKIETNIKQDDVWCLEVSGEDKSFILKNGIVTGNCSGLHIDKPKAFQNVIWLLLAGAGVGFSVQYSDVNKLPKIKKPSGKQKIYVVPDTCEGWADALGVLLSSYFIGGGEFPEYENCLVEFDFSQIRPKDSLIAGKFKAPGSDPLAKGLEKIRGLLNNLLENKNEPFQLEPIHCYDILMHGSDFVISGGLRRCIAKGSKVLVQDKSFKNIEEIVVGDVVSTNDGWKKVLNTFDQGVQKTLLIKHQDGELRCTPNHKIAVLKDVQGTYEWKYAKDLSIDDVLFFVDNKNDFTHSNALPNYIYDKPEHSTTCKDITIPELTEDVAWFLGELHGDGYVRLTPSSGQVVIAVEGNNPDKAIKIQNIFNLFGVNCHIHQPTEVDDCYKVAVKSKQLADYFFQNFKQPKQALKVPECIKAASDNIKIAYLQGVLDADGSIDKRCQQLVCSVYPSFVKDIQSLLWSVGIISRFKKLSTKGLKEDWQCKYGLFLVNNEDREFFNSGSSVGYKKFVISKCQRNSNAYPINFVLNNNLSRPLNYHKKISSNNNCVPYSTFNEVFGPSNIKPVGILEIIVDDLEVQTYDIEVEDNHCFVCEGILVHNSATIALFSKEDEKMASAKTGDWFISNPQRARSNNSVVLKRDDVSKEEFDKIFENIKQYGEPGFLFVNNYKQLTNPCVEIQWMPIDEKTGETCVGFCNLCEINGKYTDTLENFLKACEAAAIIGTLQAGYTDFPYLGEATENFVRKESLLGVSITGWMDNPNILFNEKYLQQGAKKIKEVNSRIASMIGINKAARLTCAKPAGHTSAILCTSSGIHPHHAKKYIRRVQSNKGEFALKVFKQENPLAVKESVWSANKTDDVVSFLCEVPPGAIVKNQLSAIDLLEKVKLAQKNWVQYGINDELNNLKGLTHSISNTITVFPEEWDEVSNFIFENRKYFSGISLLPSSGDLDYAQAPFSTVLTPNELVREYGDASVFASGLIVDGLRAFNDNLWAACDSVLGVGEKVYDGELKEPNYPTSRNYKDLSNYFNEKDSYENWFLKKDWIRRVKQFSDRYFDGDLKRTTYCLKHVSLWKEWCDLAREYKNVNWTEYKEKEQELQKADEQAAASCAGGSCEIQW